MNTTIDVSNNTPLNWTPSQVQCEEWVAHALSAAHFNEDCVLSVKFVDKDESQALNRNYRKKDYATNVLSFPANIPQELKAVLEQTPLGDIAVCAEIVEQESLAQSKTLAAHWAHLIIHGSLHLLGFDHETESEASVMEALEIEAVLALGFNDPYQTLN